MPGIKAVLFDVYGTLFSSAAGDINAGVEKIQSSAVNPGADAASRGLSTASAPDRTGSGLDALAREYTDSASGEELVSYFHKAVRESHAASKAAYPEVLAGEIWERFPGRKIPAEEFALRYELAVNPVYPMAGAKQLLASLKEAGFVMGIISNAQFYTPLLFEALLGGSPEALGFSPELLVYSYMEGEAKPSPLLFEKARAALKKQGIGGGETVYLGNDMRNDIQGAARAGFRTVLFAGDRRSLRLREDDPLISLLPCAVVSKLADFEQLLKRSPSSADNEKGA
jgi:putative hydrolase of the HAD superfamily